MHTVYDHLVYLAETDTLTSAELLKLFPEHDPEHTPNDDMVTPTFLEDYTHARSLGLSIALTANHLGYSSVLVSELLNGKGVSTENLVSLAYAELSGVSQLQFIHLDNIKLHAVTGKWKASVIALERLTPELFSPKIDINQRVQSVTPADYEQRSLEARERLIALRKGA